MSSVLALHVGPQKQLVHASQQELYRSTRLDFPCDSQPVDKFVDWFQGGLPTPPTSKAMHHVSTTNGFGNLQPTYPPSQPQRAAISSRYRPRTSSYSTTDANGQTQESNQDLRQWDMSGEAVGHTTHDQIAPYLQIPESISSSKGSLAEFAAEITCLFWFETARAIEYAERLPVGTQPDQGLLPDAVPSTGFRKWVTTILSTTQVGKNVVLLALMFIYRLKKFNPTVSGKRGSEFRLLTIALMLGNKFLDDNTYTNKTWAEVSGITVNEIHIMEVEFLSNMRYELYASEAQWREWKLKLGRFHSFYEKALQFSTPKAVSPITPTSQSVSQRLPSPPSAQRHLGNSYTHLPHPINNVPQLSSSPLRPQLVEYNYERKRSLDSSSDIPPAKRVYRVPATNPVISPLTTAPPMALTPVALTPDSVNQGQAHGNVADSVDAGRFPHLPMPRISQPQAHPVTYLAPLSLPPQRAMSTVYSSTTGYSQPVTPVTSMPPSMVQNGVTTLPQMVDHNSYANQTGSRHTSPVNMYGTMTPTRHGQSPSYFLMNRSSPYRPVRSVNTLLIPPPSASMQSQPRQVAYDQIHYQPLSKVAAQPRVGPVPFMQPDVWANPHVTPIPPSYRLC